MNNHYSRLLNLVFTQCEAKEVIVGKPAKATGMV
jgi:hypothetical protein